MKKIILLSIIASLAIADENIVLKSFLDELKADVIKLDPSFKGFDSSRGEVIFYKEQNRDGKTISCATCHNKDITQNGLSAKTNKIIKPLAPSVNKDRLTDIAEIKKWLRRNFNDVYGREGSAIEKGDVLTFIQSR